MEACFPTLDLRTYGLGWGYGEVFDNPAHSVGVMCMSLSTPANAYADTKRTLWCASEEACRKQQCAGGAICRSGDISISNKGYKELLNVFSLLMHHTRKPFQTSTLHSPPDDCLNTLFALPSK